MNHEVCAKFVSMLESEALRAGLQGPDLEKIVLEEAFVMLCLRSALRRYTDNTKNVVFLQGTDHVGKLLLLARLNNKQCLSDLKFEYHNDQILRFHVLKKKEGEDILNFGSLMEFYGMQAHTGIIALLAFLAHAAINEDLGRHTATVLLAGFPKGHSEVYSYIILPEETGGGRKLEQIVTHDEINGPKLWSPRNLPDPCEVFMVLR